MVSVVSASPRCLFLGGKGPREREIVPILQEAGRISRPVEKGPESFSLTGFRTQVSLHGKGKAVPLQAWSGPESSRKLRFSDFMTTAQGGVKFVSLKHRPHLPPGNSPGTHFC